MAISFITSVTVKPVYLEENVYLRYENQTPLDYALTNLSKLEDIVPFFTKFGIGTYVDFYNFNKFRMPFNKNSLNSAGYIAATRGEDVNITEGDYNWDFSEDFFI